MTENARAARESGPIEEARDNNNVINIEHPGSIRPLSQNDDSGVEIDPSASQRSLADFVTKFISDNETDNAIASLNQYVDNHPMC